jgi:hypothetical protein
MDETKLSKQNLIFFLAFALSVSARAEEGVRPSENTTSPVVNSVSTPTQTTQPVSETPTTNTVPTSSSPSVLPNLTPTNSGPEKSLRDLLLERLVRRDGTPATIAILKAVETPASRLGEEFPAAIEAAMQSFGSLNMKREDFALPVVTMEEIRLTMARFNADLIIFPVVKKDSVDLFLFDRRLPYNLYAHSEQMRPELEEAPPATAARELTRLLIQRLLYRYLNNQHFELPREETLPVLQAEIPKWIASPESLNLVNREIIGRFYLNASLGAAINLSRSGQVWNSNLIGLQLGIRVWEKFYIEGQISAFSYNAFVGSLRYEFVNRNSPFRVNVGLGFSFVTRDKVWNLDQTLGLGRYSYFAVPSVSLLFPIGEVYLKLEAQAFVAPSIDQFIWTAMPGVQVHF